MEAAYLAAWQHHFRGNNMHVPPKEKKMTVEVHKVTAPKAESSPCGEDFRGESLTDKTKNTS